MFLVFILSYEVLQSRDIHVRHKGALGVYRFRTTT